MLVKLLRKDGLAVAVGTMLLYAAAYFFERGYCSRLNIPFDYIEITVPTIANVILNSLILIMPIALISLMIMQTGKKHEFRGRYALSPLYCGFLYTGVLFFVMEHTLDNFLVSAFIGGLFFLQLIPSRYKQSDKDSSKEIYFKTLDYLGAVFLVSMTFTIYGHFYAADTKFDKYVQNDHEYALLKIYGENVFMSELKDGKMVNEITYFNAQNMTGMKLIGNKGN
ncbi:hypothetical protein [Pantoea ananatis]|uniref:hypothetical protein n=1 Tax=Pantoea ananas TaxID=553 RepID=UPI000CF36B3A|nr:hypothetical protein [Pantoea ananatis]PQK83349.1 hypothetical protein CG432_22180 [Pantoea ananatis]PWV60402.1 hypothetical protein C7425_11265 [Pantoea ananatis]PWV83850.1 hypothetical protein C7426_11237 [Pantoea ananatis]REC89150.1 hypothetical protein C7423_11319 [Pantoea ananatis]